MPTATPAALNPFLVVRTVPELGHADHSGRRFGCDEKQPAIVSERHPRATTGWRWQCHRADRACPTPVNRQHGEFTVITEVRVNGQRCNKQLPARQDHYGERRVGQVEGPP